MADDIKTTDDAPATTPAPAVAPATTDTVPVYSQVDGSFK